MNIIRSGPGLQVTIKAAFLWLPHNSTEKQSGLTGATVMATSIQVFVQVAMALLFCVVTTSMGGVTSTDLHKTVSELENKVKVSQEEIKSLHQLAEQLEKRLQQLEVKGEFGEVQIQPGVPTLHAC